MNTAPVAQHPSAKTALHTGNNTYFMTQFLFLLNTEELEGIFDLQSCSDSLSSWFHLEKLIHYLPKVLTLNLAEMACIHPPVSATETRSQPGGTGLLMDGFLISNLLIAQSRPLQRQFSHKVKRSEFPAGAAVLPPSVTEWFSQQRGGATAMTEETEV